jgi:hypothetical protein
MRRPIFCLTLVFLLSACAQRPAPPVSPEARIEQQLAGAYRPARLPIAGWHAEWRVLGEPLEVDWLAPQQGHNLPVILYLPGLGEGSRAAEPLRRAWAEAGYAVLSVQAQRHGRTIYSSAEAQAGVFQNIARRAYSAEALQHRVAQLAQLWREVRGRAAGGDADFSRIDWQRQGVAGFDLGTQTASALLVRGQGWAPRAALLLSPCVPAAEVAQQIAVPLLSATGPADEDPFNWGTPAYNQRMLWQQGRTGERYQLLLGSMTHAQLGGAFAGVPQGGDDRVGGVRRGTSPAGGGGPGGGMGADARGRGLEGGAARYGRGREPMVDPRQAAALLATSVAFFDSHVQHSDPARRWLIQEARQWLPPGVQLHIPNSL